MKKRAAVLVAGALAAVGGITTVGYRAAAAQVILTDLVVQGSICAGQDCVNGESFGFDTIRLKENNLRIKFQDTSSSASFPSNDWQLTANDSTNGGANKFSIDDITGGRTPFTVEAGAPTDSLRIDDGGRLGLGTATPVVGIHHVDGNSPTLRLQQDGSNGFTAQTWDVAGNEANFFVRDATNGSKLPFKIKPGAPDNALFIDADGDIGLGTASPEANLDISNSGPSSFQLTDRTNGVDFKFETTAVGQLAISRVVDGTVDPVLSVLPNGNILLLGNVAIAGNLNVGGSVTCTSGNTINTVACA